jgi:hypothetical protein
MDEEQKNIWRQVEADQSNLSAALSGRVEILEKSSGCGAGSQPAAASQAALLHFVSHRTACLRRAA